jgi:hypothetical protein
MATIPFRPAELREANRARFEMLAGLPMLMDFEYFARLDRFTGAISGSDNQPKFSTMPENINSPDANA